VLPYEGMLKNTTRRAADKRNDTTSSLALICRFHNVEVSILYRRRWIDAQTCTGAGTMVWSPGHQTKGLEERVLEI
jgi:hypothetical protein